MRSSFYVGLPVVLLSFAFVQCKSSDDATSGSSSARSQFISSYCELAAPCCGTSKRTECTTAFAAAVPTDLDETAANACIAALRAKSTSAEFCAGVFFLRGTPACDPLAKRGTVPVGGACNDAVSGVECAQPAGSHVACASGTGGTQLCQNAQLGNEGDACVEDSNDDGSLPVGASIDGVPAATGTYCNRASGFHCSIGKCVKLVAIGEPCTGEASCVLGAYCPFSDPPKCLAMVADGQPCVGGTECISQNCDTTKKQCSGAASQQEISEMCGG